MSIESPAIDGKKPARGVSARLNRRTAILNKNDEKPEDKAEPALPIRVKERTADEHALPGKKTLIGGLFKETPIRGLLKEGVEAAENIKRPLTGLFRRPGSRSGNRKNEDRDEMQPPPPVAVRKEEIFSPVQSFQREDPNSPVGGRSPVAPPRHMTDYDAIARAPHMTSTQLHGLMQIDSLTKHPQLYKLDDIDISLLSRFMCLEEEVRDEAVPWNWDYLFATVSTEMRHEWSQDD